MDTYSSAQTPNVLVPPSQSLQASHGFSKESQRPKESGITQPGNKFDNLSPQATPCSSANLPKLELSDHRSNRTEIKQERTSSPSNSEIGEKFIQDMIDIQRQQQRHNEQLMHMQQYRDQQLQQLLGQHQQLSLTLTLPHAEVQTFDGDPINYCNFI